MNKVILGLILAVCVLGMALVMLNERLGRKNEPAQAQTEMTETTSPVEIARNGVNLPNNQEVAERAMAVEQEDARQSLAPSMEENKSVQVPSFPEVQPEPVVEKVEVPPVPTVSASPEKPEPAAKPEPVAKPEPAPRPEPVAKPAPKAAAPEPKTDKPVKQDKPPVGKVVNRFVVFARDGGATIRVGSPAKVSFTNMTLENPDRVVVDMDGDWQFPVSPGIPKNEIVSKIRTGKMGEKTRVVIDLKSKPKSVRVIPAKNGDGYDVRVDK